MRFFAFLRDRSDFKSKLNFINLTRSFRFFVAGRVSRQNFIFALILFADLQKIAVAPQMLIRSD